MYNLYKLINNSTPELVAQYANPIRDLQNEIAKTDPEAAQNPFLGEYIKQIYDNMNTHFAHQVSVEQPTVAPEIAQIKPYVNDQLKTMTKNIKGIKYNIQDSSSKISQQQFQQNLLGLYSTVNDLISKDPAYQKQMDDYMVRYTDQQIPADKAYALAMEDVNQDVIE